ncbi:MAG: hypothetical protein M3R14_05325, partial [Acidobacteriota bacterium]|nr:hypothetical protein [Acidobacteriota bacterium]
FNFRIANHCAWFSADAFAQTKFRPRNSINNRQQYQQKRIVRGVKSGELTAWETHRLGREQYQIHRMETRFRHSGEGLSNRERYRLQRELNQSSRHIYRQKHDRQDYPKP